MFLLKKDSFRKKDPVKTQKKKQNQESNEEDEIVPQTQDDIEISSDQIKDSIDQQKDSSGDKSGELKSVIQPSLVESKVVSEHHSFETNTEVNENVKFDRKYIFFTLITVFVALVYSYTLVELLIDALNAFGILLNLQKSYVGKNHFFIKLIFVRSYNPCHRKCTSGRLNHNFYN